MMLVPARADRSAIHGIGLFTIEKIPAGRVVWRYQPGFDRSFPASEVEALPAQARAHLRHYGYLDAAANAWILNGDLAIFLNHSNSPNTGAPGQVGAALETVALRDILIGEELTCDYGAFDASSKPVFGLAAGALSATLGSA